MSSFACLFLISGAIIDVKKRRFFLLEAFRNLHKTANAHSTA